MQVIKDFISSVGKAPSNIHKINKYDQSQRKTTTLGWYEKANDRLKPRTYVERKAKGVQFLTVLRSLYPVISVALALVTAYLIGDLFTDGMPLVLKYGLIFIISGFVFLITVWVENEKKTSLASLFRVMRTDIVGKGETIQAYGLAVGLTMVFSIGVSALGGFQLTTYIQDETPELQKAHSTSIDSLNSHYAALVEPYDLQIQSAKETLTKHPTGWRGNVARQDIAKAGAAKQSILEQQKADLALMGTEHKTTLQKSGSDTYQLALICAGIVILFELFYAFSFFAEYTFYAKAERENANHNILTVTDTNESDNDPLQALTSALTALTSSVNVNPQMQGNTAANVPVTPSKVGFQQQNVSGYAHSHANEQSSKYWHTRPELCNDLQAKLDGSLPLSYIAIAQKHGVCEATVHRVKKSIFDL